MWDIVYLEIVSRMCGIPGDSLAGAEGLLGVVGLQQVRALTLIRAVAKLLFLYCK